jgi:hypothetical protein
MTAGATPQSFKFVSGFDIRILSFPLNMIHIIVDRGRQIYRVFRSQERVRRYGDADEMSGTGPEKLKGVGAQMPRLRRRGGDLFRRAWR